MFLTFSSTPTRVSERIDVRREEGQSGTSGTVMTLRLVSIDSHWRLLVECSRFRTDDSGDLRDELVVIGGSHNNWLRE